MATCGEYELEKAIGWGRRATCFAARVSGAGGESTIVIRRARSAERAISQAFFRAAAEQQTAVGAGCRRLAPILSFERDESGFAFYATTRYETSLADFLEADCKVDSVLLRENVTSLLGALRELHEKSRRAHGNLTPGNILLDPHGRIFLTDLAPSAKDATAADDLFALGMLIYQLVRRTARIGTLNPPLDYSPAWTDSLGDEAAGWLAFTNRLLDKPRNASPDAIKTAIDDLSDLKKLAILAEKEAQTQVKAKGDGPKDIIDPPRAKKRSPLPKVIAIILLLAGGGGGYVWYKGKKAAEEKRRIIAEETRRIEILNATLPPAVKDLPAKLTQLPKEIRDKGKILGDGTLDSRLSRIVESLNNGSWTRSNIEDHLRNWPLPGELQAKAAKWKDAPHQWTALARNLEAAANISLDRDESLVEQALTAIAISKEASDLDIQWEDIARTLKDLSDQKNQIPSLPEFTPWAENEIRNVSDLKKAPDRAQATLKALRVLLAFLKSDSGSRVRWESFDKKILEVPTIELMPDWPNQWRQEAERLVVPEKKTRDEWDKYLAKIEAQIPGLPAKERPDWQKKLDDSRALAAGAMESQIALVEKDLLKFRGMRTQIERARDQYTVFLGKWKPKVAALDKDDKEAKKKATDFQNLSL